MYVMRMMDQIVALVRSSLALVHLQLLGDAVIVRKMFDVAAALGRTEQYHRDAVHGVRTGTN